ncbi:MAG: hypothetical protein WD077_08375 [Bacteroidia bacterium]
MISYYRILTLINKRYALVFKPNKKRFTRVVKAHKAVGKDLKDVDGNGLHHLFGHFKKTGIKYKNIPLHVWGLLHEVLRTNNRSPELRNAFDDCPSDSLTPGEWIELATYLLSFGLFQEAVVCRHKSHASLKSLKSRIHYNLQLPNLLMSSLFDQGLWEEHPGRMTDSHQFKLSPFYRKFFGKEKAIGKEIDPDYYELINGKRMAVIGPLSFDKDYSEEINGADLIVELNALESKREGAKSKYHGRPDIAYYNNGRIKRRTKETLGNLIRDCKYFVFKDSSVFKNEDYEQVMNKSATKARVIPGSAELTWNGTFSMMEKTVSDLLLFDPAEIKVYGVDLYLSFDYSKGYGNLAPQSLSSMTINFTAHDIFTQFSFMRNLMDRGLIKADDRLSKVIGLDIEGYAEKLEELYPVYVHDGPDDLKRKLPENA